MAPHLPWRADLYLNLLNRVLDPATSEPERTRTRALMRDLVGGRTARTDANQARAGLAPPVMAGFGDLIRDALTHRIEGREAGLTDGDGLHR